MDAGDAVFGAQLRAIRLERGWSQHTLADRADMQPKHVSRLETGERTDPRLSTVRRLAEALNVSPARLLEEEERA
jgi:transcriptional regulator with XRE-family HTH domain